MDDEAAIENRVIYLHDDIDHSEYLTPRVAINFLKQLHSFSWSIDPLTVHMYCYGGDYYAGMLIYDAILTSRFPIDIVVHGAAISMATVILQAARCRILQPSSELLIHWGEDSISGTRSSMLSHAQFSLHKQTQKMLNIYVNRCKSGNYFVKRNMSEKRVKSFIKTTIDSKTDWYLTAEDAVDYGFADKIEQSHPSILLVG